MARADRPRLAVDLGSGTGLSAEVWAGRAVEVVGVEPNPEMRRKAESRAPANVRYLDAYAQATGLPDEAADVVTASQSLHWMEPEPTFAEIARILRPGGVFAAYDFDWPPTVLAEVDAAFETFLEAVRAVRRAQNDRRRPADKEGHLRRMRESGRFSHVREVLVHSEDSGDAARLLGLALSQGPVARLLHEEAASERDLRLDELRDVAERELGTRAAPWLFSYRVRLGVR